MLVGWLTEMPSRGEIPASDAAPKGRDLFDACKSKAWAGRIVVAMWGLKCGRHRRQKNPSPNVN